MLPTGCKPAENADKTHSARFNSEAGLWWIAGETPPLPERIRRRFPAELLASNRLLANSPPAFHTSVMRLTESIHALADMTNSPLHDWITLVDLPGGSSCAELPGVLCARIESVAASQPITKGREMSRRMTCGTLLALALALASGCRSHERSAGGCCARPAHTLPYAGHGEPAPHPAPGPYVPPPAPTFDPPRGGGGQGSGTR